jgi:hypothetical protein
MASYDIGDRDATAVKPMAIAATGTLRGVVFMSLLEG